MKYCAGVAALMLFSVRIDSLNRVPKVPCGLLDHGVMADTLRYVNVPNGRPRLSHLVGRIRHRLSKLVGLHLLKWS